MALLGTLAAWIGITLPFDKTCRRQIALLHISGLHPLRVTGQSLSLKSTHLLRFVKCEVHSRFVVLCQFAKRSSPSPPHLLSPSSFIDETTPVFFSLTDKSSLLGKLPDLTNAHFVGGVATGLHSNGGGSPVPFAFSVGQYPTVSEPVINWQDPFNPGYFNTVEIALSYGSDALYVFPDMSFIDDNIDAPGGLACLEGGAYSHCPVLQNGQSIEVLMSGYGTGAPGAFYLTETYTEGTGLPAPGGLALFGFGLAGLGALRRRKVA